MFKLIIIAVVCSFTSTAYAEIFKYHDANGRLYITDKKLDDSYKLVSIFNPKPTANLRVEGAYKPEAYAKNVSEYLPHIEDAAKQHQIDPHLLRAIVDTESAFDPKAYSKTGAVGLMQLMPKTAKGLGVKNSWNPKENVQGGARYFRQLLDRFNQNIKLSLAAYNAGESAVRRAGNAIPNYPETQRYVKKVMSRYTQLKPSI